MRLRIGVSIALVVLTATVYAQVHAFEFLNYDDQGHVTGREELLNGLSGPGVRWVFSTLFVGNYIPVTGLTFLLDYEIYGPDPGGYHVTNAVFHAANAVLLFLILAQFTGRVWPAALVAALFANHPLHVESVAWVSERKDVVSTFFGLLAVAAYGRFIRTRGAASYFALCLAYLLSLLAKPMLVTLPFVLLLLDFWPLGRAGNTGRAWRAWIPLTIEKLPLFVPAAVVCAITIYVQRVSGSIPPGELLPLSDRAANALVSYTRYLVAAVWPADLIPYYVHPKDSLPVWLIVAATAFLAAVTAAVWALRARRPYLMFGWLWYVGTLVPVIGLVQVGGQAMADRYTYVPLAGIFVALAWGLAEFAAKSPRVRYTIVSMSVVVIAALGLLAYQQTARWRDSITLFEYTLSIDPDNPVALGNLGDAYLTARRYDDAVELITRGLGLNPGNIGFRRNLAMAQRALGRLDEAERSLRLALERDPGDAKTHNQLAVVLLDGGRADEAEREFNTALEVDPGFLDAHVNYGNLLLRRGNVEGATRQYQYVLDRRPRDANALSNLGTVRLLAGDYPAAIDYFRRALALESPDAITRTNLAVALKESGRPDQARAQALEALEEDPSYEKARLVLQELDARAGTGSAPPE